MVGLGGDIYQEVPREEEAMQRIRRRISSS
jgi:hypothetical protein